MGESQRRHITDPRVRTAMESVNRRAFVPRAYEHLATRNRPLPIGHQQTISQPYIVALMTQQLDLQPGERVLEIGTGSGYQAAVLAEMGVDVFSIEVIPELAERAARVLAQQGYHSVEVRLGDGYHGWPEEAPFDAILLTAAPEEIPPPLLDQLGPGGRLIAPVGRQSEEQTLRFVHKREDGSLVWRDLGAVAFVPFMRGQ